MLEGARSSNSKESAVYVQFTHHEEESQVQAVYSASEIYQDTSQKKNTQQPWAKPNVAPKPAGAPASSRSGAG